MLTLAALIDHPNGALIPSLCMWWTSKDGARTDPGRLSLPSIKIQILG